MAYEVAERIQTILSKAEEEFNSVEVHKDIPYDFDLRNLLVTDRNTIRLEALNLKENKTDTYLKTVAREGIQALISKIWELPTNKVDSDIFVTLPPPALILPREKGIPKERPLTKWQEYAKTKGIVKKKKNKVWDEELQKWIPLYGYLKTKAQRDKNWLVEVPGNSDPYENPFVKMAEIKKENIAKNEYQRLKNIAKSRKLQIPNVGFIDSENLSKSELTKALTYAKESTASLGKFQENLRNEKVTKVKGKKRTREFISEGQEGRKKALQIFDKVKMPEMKTEAAVTMQIREENIGKSKKKKQASKRRSKAGGRKRTRSDFKAAAVGRMITKRGKPTHKQKGKGKRRTK